MQASRVTFFVTVGTGAALERLLLSVRQQSYKNLFLSDGQGAIAVELL